MVEVDKYQLAFWYKAITYTIDYNSNIIDGDDLEKLKIAQKEMADIILANGGKVDGT